MTIQVPNPGTGNGATGDNEFVLWSKVKTNFEDQNNAASRLVGKDTKNIMEVGAFGIGAITGDTLVDTANTHKNGFYAGAGASSVGYPVNSYGPYNSLVVINRATIKNIMSFGRNGAEIIAINSSDGSLYGYVKIYGTNNTTVDSNGFIKAASPIVKVYADKVALNDDAASQNITFVKNGIGDYTITTVSGLSTDGWYIELPKDLNGNPKIAVTIIETEGIITLKSYKRIFSMATFTFEPDLDEPLDVPDGRWIDLRLNKIPITDSVPLYEPIVPDSEV